MFSLAVEMWDYPLKKYGAVHRAGCKDLRDGYVFSSESITADQTLLDAFISHTGWEDHEIQNLKICPCVKNATQLEKDI